MKAIRTYQMHEGKLICRTFLPPEDDSLNDMNVCDMEAVVDPDFFNPEYPIISIKCDPDAPFDIILNETRQFLNTLTQMFYGS